MARPNPSDVPQELIDQIIDHCSRNKKTLIACSLTSRAWVYRSRKHLFAKLTLTDKTLPVWCGIVVAREAGSRPEQQAVPNSHPPVSSSYAPRRLPSYVTSLHLASASSPISSNNLGAHNLFQAKSHLSAFTNLKSLTLTAVSFIAFHHVKLKACFSSLAETVRDLGLSMCLLNEDKFSPLLRLFTHLESFLVDANTWYPSVSDLKTKTSEKDQITLRGSFTALEFGGMNHGLLDFLATTNVECHTITFGYNHPSTVTALNVLLTKCKDHLKILTLTAPGWCGSSAVGVPQPDQVLNLSVCNKLVEIQALFNHAEVERIISILKTVGSPRFRKLTLTVSPFIPTIGTDSWEKLDEEVSTLAERVNATAVTDTLEVSFSPYSTALGELVLSEIESVLPHVVSDARVSLRVKKLPLL